MIVYRVTQPTHYVEYQDLNDAIDYRTQLKGAGVPSVPIVRVEKLPAIVLEWNGNDYTVVETSVVRQVELV